ncbi:phage/plasmid primase, P4 family [Crossiella sp. CA198]|uniref:phage/plasmid primase, P4 family n=1 Tax=Crossiella sp. CA198 TaxID=3455607 RepID=UPI003F8D24B9
MKLNDLLDRLAAGGGLTEQSDGWLTHCPAHHDRVPSLRIALAEGGKLLVRCRAGCETAAVLAAATPPLTFADLSGVDSDGYARTPRLHTPAGPVSIADQVALRTYVLSRADLLHEDTALAEQAREYLQTRFGVLPELARRLDIGLEPGDGGNFSGYLSAPFLAVPRIVVPFGDEEGVHRGMQGRALAPSIARWCGPINPAASAWSKFALFPAETGLDTLVVCEGPGDGLTACAAGFDSVVLRGASITQPEVLAPIARWAKIRGKRIVVAGQDDSAGQRFVAGLRAAFAHHGLDVATLTLPKGLDDADLSGWHVARGERFAAELYDAVNQATPDSPTVTAKRKIHSFDDLGNAARLVEEVDGNIRYIPALGYLHWDGRIWRRDDTDATRYAAQEVAKRIGAEITVPGPDGVVDRKAAAHAKYTRSSRGIDSMLKEFRSHRDVVWSVDELDRHHHLLACRNGIVDLRNNSMFAHDRTFGLTKLIDVDYVPNAVPTRWLRFLGEVFEGQPELVGYVQRLIGYGITGESSEQCYVTLLGAGANGKSVFMDVLFEIFRTIAATTPFSTFEKRFGGGGIPNDLAALHGSRLVFASEGEANTPMAESVIKRLTGQDPITARFLNREFFTFKPTFLIFMATNHRPLIKGQDEGFWRRVRLVPFRRFFAPAERDPNLAKKLLAEAPAILSWAVRGAQEWYANGLQDPAVVTRETQSYRETSDILAGFIPGILEQIEDPHQELFGPDVYLAYREWAEAAGMPYRDMLSARAFYGALEERGAHRKRRSRGIYLTGVRWGATTDGAASGTEEESTVGVRVGGRRIFEERAA